MAINHTEQDLSVADRELAHDCDENGGEECVGCYQCARTGKYESCGFACSHDNGETKRCTQVDDPYYGGAEARCILVAGHKPKVCITIDERSGAEVWWT